MIKKIILIINLSFLLFFTPSIALGAEILQVKGPLLIQVGDSNRNYMVKLSCLDIEAEKDYEAKEWLKRKLPRGQKVNLLPQGSKNGILEAKVINLLTKKEINNELVSEGLAQYNCN